MEEWRPIEGYHPYEVSSLGRVRREGRVLKISKDSNGRSFVRTYNNSIEKSHLVYRLVAKAFIANPDEKGDVDHIKGNRQDDRVENLRWATRSENIWNTGKGKRKKSGYKGVCWDAKRNAWRAEISAEARYQHLGYFDTPEEAAAVYQCAADFYRGVFHRAE